MDIRGFGISHSNIRNSLTKGLDNMEKSGKDLAQDIQNVNVMNQIDMIKLQQKITTYTNNSALYSSLFKTLADTDKNIIQHM